MIHFIPVILVIDEEDCKRCGTEAKEIASKFVSIKTSQGVEINGVKIRFEFPKGDQQ
jgi:hypothetical protein